MSALALRRIDLVDRLLALGLALGLTAIAARLLCCGHAPAAAVGYAAFSAKDLTEWGTAIIALVGSGSTAAGAVLLVTRRFFGWPDPGRHGRDGRPRKRRKKADAPTPTTPTPTDPAPPPAG